MRRASPPDSSEQPLPRKALAHRREPRARPRARGRLEVRLDCRFPRISGHGPGREICRVWRGQELKWADLRAPRVSSWRTLPAHQNVTDWASDLGFPLVGASSAPVLELALRRRNKASFPKPCVAGSIPAGGTTCGNACFRDLGEATPNLETGQIWGSLGVRFPRCERPLLPVKGAKDRLLSPSGSRSRFRWVTCGNARSPTAAATSFLPRQDGT